MKKILVGLVILLSSPLLAQTAQSLVPDTNVPKTMLRNKKPQPYPYSREADIVWSRRYWRVIDLREKINFPLYFPTLEMQGRKSLVQTLVEAINEGRIKAYSPESDEFTTLLTPEELKKLFGAEDRTITREKIDGSGDTTIVTKGSINWSEVKELMIKEERFFDKHYSRMFTRIIGICPIRVYNSEFNTGEEETSEGQQSKKKLFWVYFPEAREVLANTVCFVSDNEASNISYDDLFQLRRFSSYIVAEGNVMDNRTISSYTRNGLEAILESQRIEREMFNFEHDLWEY